MEKSQAYAQPVKSIIQFKALKIGQKPDKGCSQGWSEGTWDLGVATWGLGAA